MSTTKRVLALSLILILFLSFVFVSCAKEPAQTPPSQPATPTTTQPPKTLSAQEIASNAVDTSTKIDAYKLDMNMSMTVEVSGGTSPGKLTILQNVVSFVNNANKEMKLTTNMKLDIPGQGKQDMSIEIYVVSGWMYMKMSLPQVGEQWVKMKLTDELWASQNQISQQVAFIKTATEVTSLGTEKVDGTDCYVLQVKPNMEALVKWVLSQSQQQQTGIDLSKLNLSKLFKSFSIKEWVAKDSFLPMKEDIGVLMEMRPEDVGATAKDFEKMTMDISGQLKFYDYGKRVPVELPQGASKALEMPSQK